MSDYSLALNTLVDQELMVEDHVKPILETLALLKWHEQQIKNFTTNGSVDEMVQTFISTFAEYKQRYDPITYVTGIKDKIINYRSKDRFNFISCLIADYEIEEHKH